MWTWWAKIILWLPIYSGTLTGSRQKERRTQYETGLVTTCTHTYTYTEYLLPKESTLWNPPLRYEIEKCTRCVQGIVNARLTIQSWDECWGLGQFLIGLTPPLSFWWWCFLCKFYLISNENDLPNNMHSIGFVAVGFWMCLINCISIIFEEILC